MLPEEIVSMAERITDLVGYGEYGNLSFYNNGFVCWIPTLYIVYKGKQVFAYLFGENTCKQYDYDPEWVSELKELYSKSVEEYYQTRYEIS
jgi:nitroimidazol reductase NimA-like FMN-containing flavoprotein (pyridoxamine 5'-phosphate oxidase superfamily)